MQNELARPADQRYNSGTRIFISYDNRDQDVAEVLAALLSETGHEVWYSAAEILPGDNWALEVGKALEECDAMVVVLSPSALASNRIMDDVSLALGSSNYSDRLIPVQAKGIAGGHVPWILKKMKLVRYVASRPEEAIRQIIERLERAPV